MNKDPNSHKGHRARFRARYIKEGLDAFAEHEVLELLLYYCYPQRNTNEIAHAMLREFGSLYNLFEADVPTLMSRLNCSENIAVLLHVMPAVANRYFRSKWGRHTVFKNAKIAGEYAISLFVGHTNERFYLLNLDARNHLINVALISQGTLDEAAIYPREVVKAAVQNNAHSVILAHNHPGGTLKPSRGDLEVTRHIVDGLKFIHITVTDHIIVAGDTYYSFAARNQHVAGY
jgi:DNA repair protein RadC